MMDLDLSTRHDQDLRRRQRRRRGRPRHRTELGDHVLAALQEVSPHLVLDLTGVTFMDSTGLKVLLVRPAPGRPGAAARLAARRRRADRAQGARADRPGPDASRLYDTLADVPPPAGRRGADRGQRRRSAHARIRSIRSCSCSALACAASGPPQACRSSVWTAPCGIAGAVVPGADQAVELLAQRRAAPGARRLAGRPRPRPRRRAATAGRLRALPVAQQGGHLVGLEQARAGRGSPPPPRTRRRPACRTRRRRRAPGRTSPRPPAPRTSSSSSAPGSVCGPVGRGQQRVLGRERGRRRRRRLRSSAWSRSTSISAACCSSSGTDGRNTEAVSPRRRARTNRPTAWAKNSGVEVDVA